MGVLVTPAVTLRPTWTRSRQILLESDWFPGFSYLTFLQPLPQLRTECQSLTSTLMAQRPMARTAFRTKSTSTSVAYSLSSAKTCGPKRENGIGGDLVGQPPGTLLGRGMHRLPRRMRFCLLLEVEGLREGESCQVPPEKSREGLIGRDGQPLFRLI